MREIPKVCLLGASFDTGNMGVSALAESSIKCILNNWPYAEVMLLDSGREDGEHRLKIMNREISIRKLPIRFCKNVFLPNHYCILVLYALLSRLLPQKRLKAYLMSRNWYFKQILETDIVADITGGDSFSDLYGMRRFILGFLCNWLVEILHKKLILLPQTYGPFKRSLTKTLARHVLNYATVICSRDRDSIDRVKNLLNTENMDSKVKLVPDVAFVLDSCKPSHPDIDLLADLKAENTTVVGLNISGLLYNGGYTKNNMFGLKNDYRSMVYRIIDLFMDMDNTVIILVPHVFPPRGLEVESDRDACLAVYESVRPKYGNKVLFSKGQFNHAEIKYIIGLCDFFIGSRMHACIAALSQGVPAIGLAYSKKFEGVFETVGCEHMVVDICYVKTEEALATITMAFSRREIAARHLRTVVPEIQKRVLNMFEDIQGDV